MNWLALILSGLKLLGALADYLRERKLISAEQDRELVAELKAQLAFLEKADAAREDARRRNAAVPRADSLPDDGFRRD